MADGPAIYKRIGAAPPTDLPDTPLAYPGKPLAHRYMPTEKSRKVEEDVGNDLPKLASDTYFSPVASLNYGDKNIHLGSIGNTRPRSINPVALGGSISVHTNPSQKLDVHDDIHKPLTIRLQQAASRHKTPIKLAESTTTLEQPTNPTQNSSMHTQNFLTEIERLKEAANKELSERSVPASPQISEPVSETVQTPPPPIENPLNMQLAEGSSESLETASIPQPTNYDEGTQRLLGQAEQLEKELTKLREGITHKEVVAQQKIQSENFQTEAYEAQISQLVADRTSLANRINELTAAHSEELNKRKELEQKIQQEAGDFEQRIKSTEEEKAQLSQTQEEQKNKAGILETQLQQMEQEFQSKLQTIETEKNSLQNQLDQIKETEQPGPQKEQLEKEVHVLRGLRDQFENVNLEANKLKEENTNLQKLIEELQKSSNGSDALLNQKQTEVEEEKEPKKDEEKPLEQAPMLKPPQDQESPHIRVVKPQAAVGRMAPSLTTSPNVINGVVKDTKGMFLSNVILVVKDSSDQPVRALKTNKIGQFAISTPLPNGVYTLELEADDHSFDMIQVDVEGRILPPIEIKANS